MCIRLLLLSRMSHWIVTIISFASWLHECARMVDLAIDSSGDTDLDGDDAPLSDSVLEEVGVPAGVWGNISQSQANAIQAMQLPQIHRQPVIARSPLPDFSRSRRPETIVGWNWLNFSVKSAQIDGQTESVKCLFFNDFHNF